MGNIIKLTKTPDKKSEEVYAGVWMRGCQHALIITRSTPKSVTLEVGGVSLGKHFGEVKIRERKPS